MLGSASFLAHLLALNLTLLQCLWCRIHSILCCIKTGLQWFYELVVLLSKLYICIITIKWVSSQIRIRFPTPIFQVHTPRMCYYLPWLQNSVHNLSLSFFTREREYVAFRRPGRLGVLSHSGLTFHISDPTNSAQHQPIRFESWWYFPWKSCDHH